MRHSRGPPAERGQPRPFKTHQKWVPGPTPIWRRSEPVSRSSWAIETSRLAQAIAPDGALMLGAGETVLGQTDAFVSDADNRGLYVPAAAGQDRLETVRVA